MSNQETGNLGSLADLLGSEEAEVDTQSSETASEDASKETATTETKDDILDLLAKDDESEESEESPEEGKEDKKESGAQKRIQQLVSQRNDEREARQAAESELESFGLLNDYLTEVYGDSNSFEALRADVGFLRAMVALSNNREDVQQVVTLVKNYQNGKLPEVSREGNRMSTQSDTKADTTIAKEVWSDRIDAVLAHPGIPSELRTLATRIAHQQFDPSKISKVHAAEVVVEILKESGWTPKRSETSKTKPPTVASKRAGTTKDSTTTKAEGSSKSEGPKSAREFSALLEEQFNAALLKG